MSAYALLKDSDPPLAFLDCQPLGPTESIVIAAMWGLEDSIERPTRLLHIKGETVTFVDVAANLISLCLSGGVVWALAKAGFVVPVYPKVGQPIPLGRAGGGSMLRLRALGDTQFACGMNGQVARQRRGQWDDFDDGVYSSRRDAFSVQLRDIAGVDGGPLLTVGLFGTIFEHRTEWQQQEVPTNAHLEQVICDEAGTFWVAGQAGTILVSENSEWRMLEPGSSSWFWGLAKFKGDIYLSAFDGLYLLDQESGTVAQIDPDLETKISTYRLQASEFDLWSIGQEDIARYDGTRWRKVKIPSNA